MVRSPRAEWLPLVLLGVALTTVPSCSQTTAPPKVNVKENDPSVGPPFYKDMTATSGIDFTYRNGQEAAHYAILESLGGGVGLIDFDGDGLLDIFVPGGGYYDGPQKTT